MERISGRDDERGRTGGGGGRNIFIFIYGIHALVKSRIYCYSVYGSPHGFDFLVSLLSSACKSLFFSLLLTMTKTSTSSRFIILLSLSLSLSLSLY
jgi:hypothetical protein